MPNALDLSEIDPPIWRVLIEETAYGPYTLGQMRAFIDEGRIGLRTKVAKGDGAPFVDAETVPNLQPALRGRQTMQASKPAEEENDQPHNYLVISRMSGGGEESILHRLNNLGSFGEAMPGVFVLRSKSRLATIQKTLRSITGAQDKVIIVDASSNRLGWFNLGPEADIHLRSIWDKPID